MIGEDLEADAQLVAHAPAAAEPVCPILVGRPGQLGHADALRPQPGVAPGAVGQVGVARDPAALDDRVADAVVAVDVTEARFLLDERAGERQRQAGASGFGDDVMAVAAVVRIDRLGRAPPRWRV